MEFINNKNEIKFLINEIEYEKIKSWIKRIGYLDENCKSDSYKIITGYILRWNNKIKHEYKETSKLRIRRYFGSENNQIYLEEKRKRNGIVIKKRINISEIVAKQYFLCNSINEIKKLNEDNQFKLDDEVYINGDLIKKCISYSREPYIINFNKNNYRVTIDSNISLISDNNNFFLDNIYDNENDSFKRHILEIKGDNIELITSKLRNEYSLIPQKISKLNLILDGHIQII